MGVSITGGIETAGEKYQCRKSIIGEKYQLEKSISGWKVSVGEKNQWIKRISE